MIKKTLIAACGLLILAALAAIVVGNSPLAGQSRVTPVVEIYATAIVLDTSHAPVSTPQVRQDDISEFVLSDSLRLPESPVHVPIYAWAAAAAPSVDQFHAVAAKFGFDGPLYTAPKGSPLQGYVAIAGNRLLIFSNGFLSYMDRSVPPSPPDINVAPLPFERAAPIATDFLASHGISTTGYRAEPVLNQGGVTAVRFASVVDGRPAKVMGRTGLQVDVSADGRVQSASLTPLSYSAAAAGDAGIVNVQEALQKVQARAWLMRQSPFVYSDPQQNPVRSWQPQYRPGEPADLWNASLMVLSPVDPAGQPYVEVSGAGLRLQGKLDELVARSAQPLRIWGTVRQQDGWLALDVAGWSSVPPSAQFQGIPGSLSKGNGHGSYLLQRADGRTNLLHHVPDDVPQGRDVMVYAMETDRSEDGHTVLYWTSIQSTPATHPAMLVTATPAPASTAGQRTATAPAPSPSPGLDAAPVPPFPDGQRLEGVEGRLAVVVEQNASGDQTGVRAELREEPLDHAGWAARLDVAGLLDVGGLDGLRVRVWGRYDAPARLIHIERYERADPGERIKAWLGKLVTATVQGRTIELFETASGERLVPANTLRFGELPPAQVLSYQVIKEGVLRAETFGGYRIVETLDERYFVPPTAPDFANYQLTARPRVERVYRMGKGFIEGAELAYLVQGQIEYSDPPPPDGSPALALTRPIWCFTGHTESGSAFELWVDALTAEAAQQYGFQTR